MVSTGLRRDLRRRSEDRWRNAYGRIRPRNGFDGDALVVHRNTGSVCGNRGPGDSDCIAGRLPRWCGAAVIAGSPPFVFLAFMIVNFVEMRLSSLGLPSEVPGGIGWGMLWVLAGVPWALVGYAIFRAGPQQPSRVQ